MKYIPDYKYERPFKTDLSKDEFKLVFGRAFNAVLADENRSFEFDIDLHNKGIINDLYFYLNYDKRYSGDLDKGVLLIGNIGSGKSILMKIMNKIIEYKCKIIFATLHAKDLLSEIDKKGIEFFRKRPLFIDDLGKEQKEGMIYGNLYRPFEDIIAYREQFNSITFVTGNYMTESYKEKYSGHIYDRMRALFNVHKLNGPSRRK